MATQVFAKTEKELSPYFAVYREILTAKAWQGLELVMVENDKGKMVPTGEVIEKVYPLSCEDKIVWCWMLDRFQFFKEQNGVWFDNQDEIAAYCGVGLSTVKRFIKKLVISGVLSVEKKPMGGARVSNSYIIQKDLMLVQQDNKPAIAIASEKHQELSQEPLMLPDPAMDEHVPAGIDWTSEAVPVDAYDDFISEVEDDGSCSDAHAYSSQGDAHKVNVVVQQVKPKATFRPGIESVDLTTLPETCYQRNGNISDKAWDWLEDHGFYIEDPENCIVQFNGKRYLFKSRQFELCSKEIAEEEAFDPF